MKYTSAGGRNTGILLKTMLICWFISLDCVLFMFSSVVCLPYNYPR